MKIAIVVPVYNVEEYLVECIESVLSQPYDNFELILINDGSTDASSEICKKYTSDERVLYIEQENKGLSFARNVGIAVATGEYLIFLDSDDYLQDGVLRSMASATKDDPVDILVTGFTTKIANKYLTTYKPDSCNLNGDKAMVELLKGQVPHVAWGKMFSRRIYKDIHFPVGRMCEDLCEIAVSFGKANYVKFISDSSLVYRRRPGSIMHTYKRRLFTDSYYVYQLLESNLKDKYDTELYSEALDTKYLRIMISNVNLALRAKDIVAANEICDLIIERKRSTKYLSLAYSGAYFMILKCRRLYFFTNELLINKLKYKLLRVE